MAMIEEILASIPKGVPVEHNEKTVLKVLKSSLIIQLRAIEATLNELADTYEAAETFGGDSPYQNAAYFISEAVRLLETGVAR